MNPASRKRTATGWILARLWDGVAAKVFEKLGPIARTRRRVLSRYNARTFAEGASILGDIAHQWSSKRSGIVLVVGDGSDYQSLCMSQLSKRGLETVLVMADSFAPSMVDDARGVSCIILALRLSRSQQRIVRQLLDDPRSSLLPVEYVALPRVENAPILEWDQYVDGDFVSPLLVRYGDELYEIYRESLTKFSLKTDVRDYLDLCQLIDSVCRRNVPGDLAEFGSYRGHSGYLTSRVLDHFGSSRTLYMFDMFESFPEESVGVDSFWSGTHKVDFEAVKRKFRDRGNVRMIKGDFTITAAQTDTGPLALAFIDCDSYRATRSLLEYLWSNRIPVGGIVAMEDYGHAALLGNRVAVHQFFDGRDDAYTYFSQFSGFFIAVKLTGSEMDKD
jgi:hypothetical protein